MVLPLTPADPAAHGVPAHGNKPLSEWVPLGQGIGAVPVFAVSSEPTLLPCELPVPVFVFVVVLLL